MTARRARTQTCLHVLPTSVSLGSATRCVCVCVCVHARLGRREATVERQNQCLRPSSPDKLTELAATMRQDHQTQAMLGVARACWRAFITHCTAGRGHVNERSGSVGSKQGRIWRCKRAQVGAVKAACPCQVRQCGHMWSCVDVPYPQLACRRASWRHCHGLMSSAPSFVFVAGWSHIVVRCRRK